MPAVYITGTDTDVGKTTISGAILYWASKLMKSGYLKLIQTGTTHDDDTIYLRKKIKNALFFEPVYRFPEPLSPHLAATNFGTEISESRLFDCFFECSDKCDLLIIEGAGGVMVPITYSFLQIEWIKKVGIPVIIVSEDKLGAINHSLLTVESLNRRNIPILGIVLNKHTRDFGNFETISKFTQKRVIGPVPFVTNNIIESCSDYLKEWVNELCKNF